MVDETDDVACVCEQRVAVAGCGLRARERVHREQELEHLLGLAAGAPAKRVPALAGGEAHGHERLHERHGRAREMARQLGVAGRETRHGIGQMVDEPPRAGARQSRTCGRRPLHSLGIELSLQVGPHPTGERMLVAEPGFADGQGNPYSSRASAYFP